MRRCLQLAELGQGNVAPNPLVGCVIVKGDKIIGEGYHKKYGEAHAEVNAIESVLNPNDLKEATLYVNLEPCAHYGKTPPCANRIVESGIKKVVIAGQDPNEKVRGKGIRILEEGGIEVITGILESEEEYVNRRFLHFHNKRRPYVILKWAQTRDGFIDIDRASGKTGQYRISNDSSKRLLHKWRAEEPSILVGTNTALNDNPSLNVRLVEGRDPLRVVIDLKGRLPLDLNLFTDGGQTIVYSGVERATDPGVEWKVVHESKGVVGEILNDLFEREIQSLIVEGGREVLQSFIDLELWNEARVFVGAEELLSGLPAPDIKKPVFNAQKLKDNTLLTYHNTP